MSCFTYNLNMAAQQPSILNVHKRIVTDEANQPVAVLIDYEDWQRIEATLNDRETSKATPDLSRFVGTVQWGEDAVTYQRRVREEWPR